MNKKPAPHKKVAAKRPTTPSVNIDEQVFIANSVIDEINKDLRYSSSSSSSENGGSFLLEISSSGPDEPEPATVRNKRKGETSTSTVPKKKRTISNNGGQKKGETSKRTANSAVMPLVPNVTSSRQTINSSVLRLREFVPDVTSSRASKATKGLSSSSRKELPAPKVSSQDPRYNKLELKTSLAVIKKIMQMDEAVPFNAPVDPVAQGLPDYFNVIDTPMDFGTICSNLQNGVKYMNSDDVYKDVNYIWENCRNYNKKGDYIVFLMKRVKKKFMNYWMSAGLRTEILRGHNAHSHSMPSSDHSMWQSRYEAVAEVNPMATNSNRMEQDNLGTSQLQPQVVLSGNVQPYQSRQPQPSTTQVPLSSQLHAGEGSNYTDMTSRARDTGDGHRKDRDSHGKTTPQTSVRAGVIAGVSMVDGAGPSAPTCLTPSCSQTSQGVHTPQPSTHSPELPSMFRRAHQLAPPEPEPEPEPELEPALVEDEVVNSVIGGRTELTLAGDVILPSDKCSRAIRKIFEKKLDVEGAKWKLVSPETKEFYFQEFKKHFFWDQAIDSMVRHAWHKKVSTRYSDLLSETRSKGVRPAFIPEDVWKRWLEVWSDPAYVRMSQQNKLNRRKGEDGPAGPVHTGGSVPHLEHRKRLAEQLGRDPTPHELFVYTHTRKHDGQSFVDKRSKEVNDRVESIREQMTQKSSTVDETQVFYEAAGGKRKSRVYGLGSEGPEYYNSHKSGKVPTFPWKTQSANQSAELKEQLKKLEEQQHATEERHEERYNVLLETIQKQTEIIHAMQHKIETSPLTALTDVPFVTPAKKSPISNARAKLRSRK